MSRKPAPPTEASLVAAARVFARERHEGQLRKGTELPYFVHPTAVSNTLNVLYPHDFELVAAGLCHDLLEDTKTTRAELVERFGARVDDLVAAVTSPRGRDWSHTRALALEQLRASPDDAVRLKAADALDNASSTVRDIDKHGLGILARFGADPARIVGWYSAIAELARARLGDELLVPLLENVVTDLRRLLTSAPEPS